MNKQKKGYTNAALSVILTGCITLFTSGCTESSANRYANMDVKTDGPEQKYEFIRLDKEVMTIAPEKVQEGMTQLLAKYGDLFDMYLKNGIEVGGATKLVNGKEELNTETAQILAKEILSNKAYQSFFHAEDSVYANGFDKEADEVTKAMGRYHSFFPKQPVPTKIMTMFSCFGPRVAVGDNNELMISLDYYIGSDYGPYQHVDGIYAYDYINLSREMLVRDLVLGWLYYTQPNEGKQDRLLDEMVYQGKIMYALEACLPKADLPKLFGYNDDQWLWCKKNERNMWNSVKENKHLYSYDRLTISKYINPAPHTVFFPYDEASPNSPESPGKAGIWLGWRLVSSYMKKHPEVTLENLLAQQDSQQLLEQSGYNPK